MSDVKDHVILLKFLEFSKLVYNERNRLKVTWKWKLGRRLTVQRLTTFGGYESYLYTAVEKWVCLFVKMHTIL